MIQIVKRKINELENLLKMKNKTKEALEDSNKKHDEYIDVYETNNMKFIWGVMSYDDLSNSIKANLYTMNDIDLLYFKDEKKYSISVETIYWFNSENAKYSYMKELLNRFTEFMIHNNYDISYEFGLYDVFTRGININTHFDTIEECYAAFKMFVNGYCSLEKNSLTNQK